jgi:protein-tyrosine phosphatase
MKQVLFVCTGNFYRSRFAESLFNYLSKRNNLDWKAKSAGLKIHLADEKAAIEGEISSIAKNKLLSKGISEDYFDKRRESLTEKMLENADLVILMDKNEHFSMMNDLFPKYVKNAFFYDAKDIEYCDPEIALKIIEKEIMALIFNFYMNNHTFDWLKK